MALEAAVRWLALALVLALGASVAAFLPHGGGANSTCPTGATLSPAGSTISPANTNCILKDNTNTTWQFQPGGSYNSSGNWPLLVNGSATTSGTQAQIGADGVVYQSEFAGCAGFPWNVIPTTPGIFVSTSVYGAWAQPTFASGIPALAQAFYRVTHGGVTTNFNTALASINAAQANDTLHWIVNPPGLDKWQQGTAPLSQAGLTLNLDASYVEGCESTANPGFLQINAANQTIDGGGNGSYANGASLLYGSSIVVQPNATSPTIKGLHLKYFDATTGILSGNVNEGVITIKDSTVEKEWGSDQTHLVYLGDDVVGSATASAIIQNDYLMDIMSGGWNLKLRPLGIGTQGHVTQSYIGCLTTATPSSAWAGCQQNGDIDMPCAGNYLIDYNSIEYGPHADNWFMIRANEESGGQACPTRIDIFSTTFVNGTTVSGAYSVNSLSQQVDPRTQGAQIGDQFGSTAGGCPGNHVTCSTVIASFSGTPPNMTITVTCNETPNCLTDPGSPLYRWGKFGPTHITADETGCATTSTLCNLKDALGNALTPANAYIFNTYLVSGGSGIQSGSSVFSTTSTSITLTCASPPCTDGFSAGVVISFIPPLNITIDHNVLVWDAPGTGSAHPPLVATSGCGAGNIFPQSPCFVPAGGKITFTNNDIVGLQHDSSCDPGYATGLPLIASGATDANGNHCYASRAAYATAKGLLNTTDFAGNTCTVANSCAAPFTFPHP